MLHGADGKNINKMNWQQFCEFQRWNEFQERADNPPMTVDFSFWIDDKLYYCTGEDHGYIITDKDWKRIGYNENFLTLLETPLWSGKSFHDCINDILFEE